MHAHSQVFWSRVLLPEHETQLLTAEQNVYPGEAQSHSQVPQFLAVTSGHFSTQFPPQTSNPYGHVELELELELEHPQFSPLWQHTRNPVTIPQPKWVEAVLAEVTPKVTVVPAGAAFWGFSTMWRAPSELLAVTVAAKYAALSEAFPNLTVGAVEGPDISVVSISMESMEKRQHDGTVRMSISPVDFKSTIGDRIVILFVNWAFCASMTGLAKASIDNCCQFVKPSPILTRFVVVSKPNSPLLSTGFALSQASFGPLLIVMLFSLGMFSLFGRGVFSGCPPPARHPI